MTKEERKEKHQEVLERIARVRKEHYERYKIGNIGAYEIMEDLRSLLDHAVDYIKGEDI